MKFNYIKLNGIVTIYNLSEHGVWFINGEKFKNTNKILLLY